VADFGIDFVEFTKYFAVS